MKYIRNFNSQEEYELYRRKKESLLNNSVSLAGSKINYYNTKSLFYVEAIDDIIIKKVSSFEVIHYSYDGVTWKPQRTDLSVLAGIRVYLKPSNSSADEHYIKVIKGTYNIGGCFINGDGSWGDWSGDCFADETGLVSAENLILVGNYYNGKNRTGETKGLFEGCVNLVKGPKAIYCTHNEYGKNYKLDISRMFKCCANLTESPSILIETLIGDYDTSTSLYLESAFDGCSILNKVDMLCKTLPNNINVANWLSGTAETGLITLNYTASTELLDQLLPTIPTNWDVRYYDSETDKYFIKFTISGIEYIAEHDMSWKEWVSSQYNVSGFSFNGYNNKNNIYNINGYVTINGTRLVVGESDKISAARTNYGLESSVYVQHIDGTLYTINNWISNGFNNDLANGVAVTNTDNQGVVVNKVDLDKAEWGGLDVDITTSYEFGTGESNTDFIINTLEENNGVIYAAKVAKDYIFPNGKTGFLPSGAEAELILNNYMLINKFMKLIDGDLLRDSYWTSSQYNTQRAYWISITRYSMNGAYNNVTKGWDAPVRAIILLDTPLIKEGETTA